ncbi:MAG: CCA tRNA nucleotidyltransferase [Octadecabacter sp.]|nr:CCA tRNA nucleotidyltransferase [Octadecabacter sp.]
MNISADWLASTGSKAVTAMLSEAGYQVYFVGGCVRNAIIGRPVSDLDLCTDALPDMVMTLAEKASLRAIPTGIDHGTVTVIADGRPYEITTFRTDVETDGRRAKVAYSSCIEDDAVRRDFTMNALYAAADGTVIDPVGGLPDLLAGHVRFINDAGARIREDYLRILRFFRFTAWYGDPTEGIDAEGLAACAAHLDGLNGLARERVGSEILKLLSADDPAPAMASMAQSGVLLRLLPGADTAALAPLVHLEGQLGRGPHLHTRLAALGVEDVKDRLRLSGKDFAEYECIRDGALSGTAPSELGFRFGRDLALEMVMLRAALMGQAVDPAEVDAASHGAQQTFPIAAKDLMPDYTGAALGARLKALEAAWIASSYSLTKADLLALP